MLTHGYLHSDSAATTDLASRFYGAGYLGLPSVTTISVASHTLYAAPFLSQGSGAIVRRLGVRVTGARSGSALQLGVYAVSCLATGYPDGIILSCSNVPGDTTGMQTVSVVWSLHANRLFWLACLPSADVTLTAVPADDGWPFYGVTATGCCYANFGLVVASHGYGLLPQTFPLSATAVSSHHPWIALRVAPGT